jgi:2-Cys peroxiredoxin 5
MFRSTLRPLTNPLTRRALLTTTTPPRLVPLQHGLNPKSSHASGFHTTRPAFIKPGDPLPDTDCLMESHPGQRVNLAEEAQRVNIMLLIGVPAAFSPACSATHIPGYANHPRAKEFEIVGVVSVNDVFV